MGKFRFYTDFCKNWVGDRFEEHKRRTKEHGLGDLGVLQMRDHEIYSGCEGQGWRCLELNQKAWHGKRWRGHCMLLPLEVADILVK